MFRDSNAFCVKIISYVGLFRFWNCSHRSSYSLSASQTSSTFSGSDSKKDYAQITLWYTNMVEKSLNVDVFPSGFSLPCDPWPLGIKQSPHVQHYCTAGAINHRMSRRLPGKGKKTCGQIDGEHGSQTGCCVFFFWKRNRSPQNGRMWNLESVCQFVFFFKYNVLDLFSWWVLYGFYHRIHYHAQLTHHLRGMIVCLFFPNKSKLS